MEKLEKVIVGLEFCGKAGESADVCLKICPYQAQHSRDKECLEFLLEDALDLLRNMEPVVHAHWIYWRENGFKRCKCSECLTSYGCLDTPRCPNCGAHMDEEEPDDRT